MTELTKGQQIYNLIKLHAELTKKAYDLDEQIHEDMYNDFKHVSVCFDHEFEDGEDFEPSEYETRPMTKFMVNFKDDATTNTYVYTSDNLRTLLSTKNKTAFDKALNKMIHTRGPKFIHSRMPAEHVEKLTKEASTKSINQLKLSQGK